MRLELTGRHVTITPALRRMVGRKLARVERMLNDTAVSAQVVLCREKQGNRADCTLHARGEKFLHSVGDAAPTWEGSVGQAVSKIVQQAQRMKGKWQEQARHGSKAAFATAGTRRAGGTSDAPIATNVRASATAASRARMPRILRASRQAVRAMSVADAAREVEAGGEIVVFRDAETDGISVMYRRASGELTLVQTET